MRHLSLILVGASALLVSGCHCVDSSCDSSEPVAVAPAPDASKSCGGYVLVPARYDSVDEVVTVQPATTTKVHVDAVYNTVSDTVLVTPGHWTEDTTPATTKEVSEQVLVSPVRKEWQKTACANVGLKPGEQVGDTYCLVTIPAVYETKTHTVVCKAACTNRQWVAPVYKTTDRQVMVSAAYDRDEPVPAKTETRKEQVLVSAARWEWRWGSECQADDKNPGPPASIPSPAPPFPIGNGVGDATGRVPARPLAPATGTTASADSGWH